MYLESKRRCEIDDRCNTFYRFIEDGFFCHIWNHSKLEIRSMWRDQGVSNEFLALFLFSNDGSDLITCL